MKSPYQQVSFQITTALRPHTKHNKQDSLGQDSLAQVQLAAKNPLSGFPVLPLLTLHSSVRVTTHAQALFEI